MFQGFLPQHSMITLHLAPIILRFTVHQIEVLVKIIEAKVDLLHQYIRSCHLRSHHPDLKVMALSMSIHYLFLQEQPWLHHQLPFPKLQLNQSRCQWIVNGKKASLLGVVHLEVFMLLVTGIQVLFIFAVRCSCYLNAKGSSFWQRNWSFMCNEGSWDISWWPEICRVYKATRAGFLQQILHFFTLEREEWELNDYLMLFVSSTALLSTSFHCRRLRFLASSSIQI